MLSKPLHCKLSQSLNGLPTGAFLLDVSYRGMKVRLFPNISRRPYVLYSCFGIISQSRACGILLSWNLLQTSRNYHDIVVAFPTGGN